MNAQEIYQTMIQAGWNPQAAVTATAIALAESGGNPGAVGSDRNGTVDRGLMQVNSVHSQYDANRLTSDPLYNAQAGFTLAGGGKNFTPWSTFNSGKYKQFLPEAEAAAAGGGGGGAGGTTTSVAGSSATPAQPQDLASQLKQASDVASGDKPVQAGVGATPTAPGVEPTPAPATTPAPAAQPPQNIGSAGTQSISGAAGVAIKTAIAAAQNHTPYVWGGNSLLGGVDCSGLIQQAYKAAGINLPRVSNAQINSGQHVDPSQMQAGDLLGWAYDGHLGGGATHIAMYIGGGMMVEALHKGEPVHIVPVRAPQFVTRVAGGGGGGGGDVIAPPASASSGTQPQFSPDNSIDARLAAIANAFGGALSSGISLPTGVN